VRQPSIPAGANTILTWPVVEGTGVTSTQLKPKATTNIPGLDPQVLVEGADSIITAETNAISRLAGDAGLAGDKRITWLLFKEAGPSSGANLEPAGLIGPVILRTVRRVNNQ